MKRTMKLAPIRLPVIMVHAESEGVLNVLIDKYLKEKRPKLQEFAIKGSS